MSKEFPRKETVSSTLTYQIPTPELVTFFQTLLGVELDNMVSIQINHLNLPIESESTVSFIYQKSEGDLPNEPHLQEGQGGFPNFGTIQGMGPGRAAPSAPRALM